MLRVLLDIVLPRACLACGEQNADSFCRRCWNAFPWNVDPCGTCAAPRRAPQCRRCAQARPSFTEARAVAIYEGVARDALMRYKLGGERRAARSLAVSMAAMAPAADVVTFVPASRASISSRGFDPAEQIARALARGSGVPCRGLLRKVRATRDSAGLGRAERRINLEGAFAPRSAAPEHVLLVDDIMTTGATAEACTRALLAGGARDVRVLTFARTP